MVYIQPMYDCSTLCICSVSESDFACSGSTSRDSNGPFYEKFTAPATFKDADQTCRNRGADLLTIMSADDEFSVAQG
jgi:hypothetical protein